MLAKDGEESEVPDMRSSYYPRDSMISAHIPMNDGHDEALMRSMQVDMDGNMVDFSHRFNKQMGRIEDYFTGGSEHMDLLELK